MTYRELAIAIGKMNAEQRESDVTIFDTNISEYFPVRGEIVYEPIDDVLDAGHPVLFI